jgi:hypothetical protein
VRAAWTKEALEERANHLPIRRLGRTEEIARVALFLAAPESGYISGATLVVDGGSVAAGAYMVEKYRRRKAGQVYRPNLFLGREHSTRKSPNHGGCEWGCLT